MTGIELCFLNQQLENAPISQLWIVAYWEWFNKAKFNKLMDSVKIGESWKFSYQEAKLK